jgi:hypothetical protein
VVEVRHAGNTNASPEEASQVAQLVRALIGRQWRDQHGERRPIGADEVLVVTPYNAHIRAIEDALAQAGCPAGVRVGRLNVATSRARAMAIIVASAGLIRVACRTPRQMYLANALCYAWESGRLALTGAQCQGLRSAERNVGMERQGLVRGEPQAGIAAGQVGEGDLGFQLAEVGAQAVVQAFAEG